MNTTSNPVLCPRAARWKRYAVGLAMVLVVLWFLWAMLFAPDVGPGAELRRAAYEGNKERVAELLRKHPEAINSHLDASKFRSEASGQNSALLTGVLSFLRDFRRSMRGRQLRAREEAGYSALDLAVRENQPEIVNLLLDHKADATYINGSSFTGFHLAVQTGEIEIVRCYLDHHVDPEVKDIGGLTTLCWAAFGQRAEIAELLLARGAKVSGNATNGMPPLHCAAEVGSLKLAELLVKNGASLEQADFRGRTPLSIARKKSNQAMVDFLTEYGAKK